MEFVVARPDAVRAINQRWLLKFWKRHLGGRRVPSWQAVEAEDFRRMDSNLSFLDVTAHDGAARFLVRFNGDMIKRVYGSNDCHGRYLDQLIPAERHAEWLAPYHRAIAQACPSYTIHDLKDRSGRTVHFERLILPFSHSGETADRILASFEFICPDGAFDGHELMRTLVAPPALRLCATIEPQALV